MEAALLDSVVGAFGKGAGSHGDQTEAKITWLHAKIGELTRQRVLLAHGLERFNQT